MGALAVRRLGELDAAERARLLDRSTSEIFHGPLADEVRRIVEDVRRDGDAALVRALARYDGVELPPERLRVSCEEIDAARASVDDDVKAAIRRGIARIRAFNERAMAGAAWRAELEPGIVVGEEARPIASAGLFVPSGKGSFPSVLMHLGTPALVAGVPRIAVAVPPAAGAGGSVDPAVLVVADELSLEEVYRVNGPAGIAALAFGTETVPRVAKVVGPGSPPVTAAQVQVQAYGCSTVMLFGPSESLIVADDSADPHLLAADLLNEAEHGRDSAALLVTPSAEQVQRVGAQVDRLLAALPEPRRSYAASAISRGGGALLVESLEEACAFASEYAPEHLQLATAEPEGLVERIAHAGEILLGPTPFAVANYVLGVPATLPTGGFARVSSGVTARTFTTACSVAEVSERALARLAPDVLALARHEGFPAHAGAIHARRLPQAQP